MVAVTGIVRYKNKILIGKKRSDSKKFLAGQWHIPEETIELNESDEVALKRCFKEEANLEIIVGKYLDSSITPSSKTEIRWYECFSSTNKVKPESDLEDLKFIPKNQVLNYLGEKAKSILPENIKNYFLK